MKNKLTLIVTLILAAANLHAQNSSNFSSGYINVDYGKLYYEVEGTGENIVLIHDGMIHSVIWDEQFHLFAKTNRVIRYDRRGYGKSPNPQSAYSNIEDLNQIFTQLNVDKAVLFGMSAGGALTIDFALKYPDKVKALVLMGAIVSGFDYTSHMFNRGGHLTVDININTDPQKYLKYWASQDPYEVYPENTKAREKISKILESNPQNVLGTEKYRYQIASDRAALKFLSEIKVPTLVLVGEFDIPDVHAHAGAISAGIPNSKREVIPNAGHLIPIEQPEIFNERVTKFYKYAEFLTILNSKGVTEAVNYFKSNNASDSSVKFIKEDEINTFGYQYMEKNKTKEAIELFTLNSIAFPNSANAFDSLAEAYMLSGNKELAIKNYEKSLELNPQNTNAVEQLKKLK